MASVTLCEGRGTVWAAIRAAGRSSDAVGAAPSCPKSLGGPPKQRAMPSQEYAYDPQLKRVVSKERVERDWFTATTEGLSRAGALGLAAAGRRLRGFLLT